MNIIKIKGKMSIFLKYDIYKLHFVIITVIQFCIFIFVVFIIFVNRCFHYICESNQYRGNEGE